MTINITDLEDNSCYYRIPILNYEPLITFSKLKDVEIKKFKWLSVNSKYTDSKTLMIGINMSKDFILDGIQKGALVIHNDPTIKFGHFVRISKCKVVHLKHAVVNNPSKSIKLYGVTGTKGKTTVAYFGYQLLEKLGFKPAYIGTLGLVFGSKILKTNNTTPSLEFFLNAILALQNLGCNSVICECSSIGLDQGRLDGLQFDGILFTGLGHDHLDYHQTMARYFNSKKKLFSLLDLSKKPLKTAVIINGSIWSKKIYKSFKDRYRVMLISEADVKIVKLSLKTSYFEYGGKIHKVRFFFVPFMLYLSGLCKLFESNLKREINPTMITQLKLPPGRFERVSSNVYVDYAHTPESLLKAIECLKSITGRYLVIVFGCGGERDPSKRPVMGQIATELADFVVITNDNPRHEDPNKIVSDILAKINSKNFCVILNRKKAISYALNLIYRKKGILLIAGKGHETYQIIGDRRFNFDDRFVVKQLLKKKNAAFNS